MKENMEVARDKALTEFKANWLGGISKTREQGFLAGFDAANAAANDERDRYKAMLYSGADLIADIRILYANDITSDTWKTLLSRMDEFLSTNIVDGLLDDEEAAADGGENEK